MRNGNARPCSEYLLQRCHCLGCVFHRGINIKGDAAIEGALWLVAFTIHAVSRQGSAYTQKQVGEYLVGTKSFPGDMTAMQAQASVEPYATTHRFLRQPLPN